mgnify:FL=1
MGKAIEKRSNGFLANVNVEVALDIMRENTGGDELSVDDLTTIRIPGGGGKFWTLPDPETGEDAPASDFAAVVLAQQAVRKYWSTSLDEATEKSAPECISPDGIEGVGDPGGVCEACGVIDRCKRFKNVLLIREGVSIPEILVLPPGSFFPMKRFGLRLGNTGKRISMIVTRFGLEQTDNPQGKTYSRVMPSVERDLVESDYDSINSIRNLFIR